MLDSGEYRTALLDFLLHIDSIGEEKSIVAEYLRFPAHDRSTLSGSRLGQDVWDHPTARHLIDVLLEDDELNRWFGPGLGTPPELRLTELRSQIASLVAAWDESNLTANQVVDSWATLFLEAVKNPEPACSRVRVLYGVEVEKRIELPTGIAVEPASSESLERFLTHAGGTKRETLRIPQRPAVFVLTFTQARREEFGSFAATTANGWADVLAENARWDIWMATGVLQRLGDAYVSEPSRFPVISPERLLASQRETHAHAMDSDVAQLDAEIFVDIATRMAALRGEDDEFPAEPVVPLWVANTFIHPAIDTPDELMTVLLGYAGCEGLLLRREDDDSRFGPRLAMLIGADVEEVRRLRRVAARWTELRGFAAHGQRPPLEAVAAYLEQPVSNADLGGSLLGADRLRQAAGSRASHLLRRVFLAFLFCSVIVDDTGLRIGLSRDELLDIIERALSGEQAAQAEIKGRVPSFVREAAF
ncbi:MAG: hypothetical protein IIC90_10305 [Chloroflexi bacterium]|nr:hypothetical protein [Chloroflexota bacterium]